MTLWEKGVKLPSYPSLTHDLKVDVLIIGGGMTGLQTLYYLKNYPNVCLVEGNTIGFGVSKNTTGKINYLQENTLGYLVKKGKMGKAHQYLNSQREGMELLKQIVLTEKIDCNLEQVSSFLVTNQKKQIFPLNALKSFLKEENITIDETLPKECTSYLDGFGVSDTYVFHPLKYMKGLLQRLSNPSIYEHTRIIKIKRKKDGYHCYTNTFCEILANKVIIACHYPFFLFPFLLPFKSYIEKSYFVATKVPKNLKYTYITMENPSVSTRFYEEDGEVYQIYLGASHMTGVHQDDLKNFRNVMENHSLKFSQDISWSNVDIFSFDHLPFVGKIQKNMYLSTAYQGWGMAQSALSAHMLRRMVLEEETSYASLFSPKRSFLFSLFCLPIALVFNTFSFLRSRIYKKSWYSDRVTFEKDNGTLIAKYRDSDGKYHCVTPICPHLKCGLIFNEQEKTWDCPCHSSRFDLDGRVLKGPTKYSISYSSKD